MPLLECRFYAFINQILNVARLETEVSIINNLTNITKYKLLAPIYDLLMGNRIINDARRKGFSLLQLKPGQQVLLVGIAKY